MPYQLIYPDYIDAATGKTLVVTPGSAYTVTVANGRISGTPAYPNDGRWASTTVFRSLEEKTVKPEPEPEPATEVLPPVDLADTMLMPAVTDKKKGPGNGEPE